MSQKTQTVNEFFQYNKDNLAQFKEYSAEEFQTVIDGLKTIVKQKDPLYTQDDFNMLGALAYFVGIDVYTNTKTMPAVVVKNVRARFEKLVLPNFEGKDVETIISLFFDLAKKFKLSSVEDLRKRNTEKIEENLPEEYRQVVKPLIYSVINNSQFPTQHIVALNKIVNEKNITFKNLLDLNNIFYEYARMTNETATKKYIELYKNPVFVASIQNAVFLSELYKQEMVMAQSLESVGAFLNTTGMKKQFFEDLIFGNLEEKEYVYADLFEVDEPEVSEEIKPTETESKLSRINAHSEAEKNEAMNSDHILALYLMIYENAEHFDKENIFATIESLFEDLIKNPAKRETGQFLYQFMSNIPMAYGSDWAEGKCPVKNTVLQHFGKTPEELSQYFRQRATEVSETLNSDIRAASEPIDENIKKLLIERVNATIKSMNIENGSEKTYLLTQLEENQINNYSQLLEITTIIESGYIAGSNMSPYVDLFNMLENNEHLAKITDKANDSIYGQDRFAMYGKLADIFGLFVESGNDEETATVTE